MSGYAVFFDLRPGPRERFPGEYGLAETAEEHGLSSSIPMAGSWRRLPPGVLWGPFPDPGEALAAFDRALADASDLLGYAIEAERRLAIGVL